jgi:catechol 2,3-dioxygenase-like lactoylglutathione lyase family enzyme
MQMKLELVPVPVTDVDRAKAFYVDQVGFTADHDRRVSDELRFVQLTPPGSACSVVIGEGVTEMAPGSQKSLLAVIADADAARAELAARGVAVSEVDEQSWGRFVYFADPDGNSWALQELPRRG